VKTSPLLAVTLEVTKVTAAAASGAELTDCNAVTPAIRTTVPANATNFRRIARMPMDTPQPLGSGGSTGKPGARISCTRGPTVLKLDEIDSRISEF
jgi:hypothetical protein